MLNSSVLFLFKRCTAFGLRRITVVSGSVILNFNNLKSCLPQHVSSFKIRKHVLHRTYPGYLPVHFKIIFEHSGHPYIQEMKENFVILLHFLIP